MDLQSNLTMTTSTSHGLNSFVVTGAGFEATNTRTTAGGGAIGGRYSFRHGASGTWVLGGGVASQAEVDGANETGIITSGYAFIDEGSDGGADAGSGGITTAYGFWSRPSAGNVGTKIGLYVEDDTNATASYGIKLDGATTAARWFNNDSGTANDGITFGATGQVNLYRSAADTLKTDDAFVSRRSVVVLAVGTLTLNTSHLATAAADYDLPATGCDLSSDIGNWVTITAQDASETVSLTVNGSEDTLNYTGLTLGANDELHSPGGLADSVTVTCLKVNNWYSTATAGAWTDGGVP